MTFDEKYRKDANGLSGPVRFDGIRTVGWRSPSNIALIKYWGKRDFQLPLNPSLSFTLDKSFTKTKVDYFYQDKNRISFDFKFEDKKNPGFEKRIALYLEQLAEFLPFLKSLHLSVLSRNSFPHSSGIASSASSFSALALCLLSIEKELFGSLQDEKEFSKKASFMARLGSGSAARSVYPYFAAWGKNEKMNIAPDEIAVPLELKIDPVFEKLQDSILIVSHEKKKISSSEGHTMMNDHPFAKARIIQANENFSRFTEALQEGDEQSFITIVENEALTLHALMMSSQPGYTLLTENSWQIITKLREFRQQHGTFVAFTLDAGPNVHLIYPEKENAIVKSFIKSELVKYCMNGQWIDDKMGSGPIKMNEQNEN